MHIVHEVTWYRFLWVALHVDQATQNPSVASLNLGTPLNESRLSSTGVSVQRLDLDLFSEEQII